MADGGVTTKDIITWAVSGLSLVITVCWNIHNRWRTDMIAKQIRSENFDLDEWKGQRSEILRLLREFEAVGSRIAILSRGGHASEALIDLVNREGSELTRVHLSLIQELFRAGGEEDWTGLAYGAMLEGESDWDRLNTVLAELSEFNEDVAAKRERLKLIAPHINAISYLVDQQLRVRTAEHSPIKL